MAHKALIGGTAYEISGGKTLVNGTAYSIDKGKTLVGGAAYEVGFEVKHVSSDGEVLDSWADISAGLYMDFYSIRNWKSFSLSDGTNIIMEIAAFNADTKTDGTTASITWISKHVITKRGMNSTATHDGGWEGSELRTWLQSNFYATMPAEVRNVVLPVKKTYVYKTSNSSAARFECIDALWIPSAGEVNAAASSANQGAYEGVGAIYDIYFADNASRKKTESGSTTGLYWWLRTIYSASLTKTFRVVVSTGGLGGFSNADNNRGVVLGFCT